jgi:putative restriction endonuclease
VDRGSLLDLVREINTWRSGDQRAPHKPLLLLALGRLLGNEPRLNRYGGNIEPHLRGLLQRFGPPRQNHHPEEPYKRMCADGLWEIPGYDRLLRTASGGPALQALRASEGGLPDPVFQLLRSDPALALEATRVILDGHFPISMHADICEAAGIPVAALHSRAWPAHIPGPVRDPNFRHRVLRAYNRYCAVCGYEIRIGDRLLGLDASHIKWHAYGGPDIVPNGLALCMLHHKALDAGALGLEHIGRRNIRILVSREISGDDASLNRLQDFRGDFLRLPQQEPDSPDPEFVDWHRTQVFREPTWERG